MDISVDVLCWLSSMEGGDDFLLSSALVSDEYLPIFADVKLPLQKLLGWVAVRAGITPEPFT